MYVIYFILRKEKQWRWEKESDDDDDDDEKDAEALENARLCCIELLKVIKATNAELDLHGGVASGTIQRIHLKG